MRSEIASEILNGFSTLMLMSEKSVGTGARVPVVIAVTLAGSIIVVKTE